MSAQILAAARPERIQERARTLSLRRVVLTPLAGVLWLAGAAVWWMVRAVGTVLGRVLWCVGAAAAWAVAAVLLGWEDARRPPGGR